jgi:hypothetical protein
MLVDGALLVANGDRAGVTQVIGSGHHQRRSLGKVVDRVHDAHREIRRVSSAVHELKADEVVTPKACWHCLIRHRMTPVGWHIVVRIL